MSYQFVYVTAPDRDAALAIARMLVEERLAACATVLDGATSVYWWESKIQETKETVMFAKTTTDNIEAAIEAIVTMHSYSVPCVVSMPISDGNAAFLDWVSTETSTPDSG